MHVGAAYLSDLSFYNGDAAGYHKIVSDSVGYHCETLILS